MLLTVRSSLRWIAVAGCLLTLGMALPAAAQGPAEPGAEVTEAAKAAMADSAAQVVEEWLTLVDADRFGAAYDEIGPPVQERIRREGWMAALEGMRQHIDAPSAREQTIAQYRPSMKKIDGGPFISFLYEGDYELGTFSEMILARRDSSRWTVVAYQVVPDMSLLREHDELSFEMVDYTAGADSTAAPDSVAPNSTEKPDEDENR